MKMTFRHYGPNDPVTLEQISQIPNMYSIVSAVYDVPAGGVFFPISCTLFTAVTDEFIQSFTGRGSSVRDVMLDFSGALTGILLTVFLSAIIKKCNRKSRKM